MTSSEFLQITLKSPIQTHSHKLLQFAFYKSIIHPFVHVSPRCQAIFPIALSQPNQAPSTNPIPSNGKITTIKGSKRMNPFFAAIHLILFLIYLLKTKTLCLGYPPARRGTPNQASLCSDPTSSHQLLHLLSSWQNKLQKTPTRPSAC